jgi:AraC family transcriptional regulator
MPLGWEGVRLRGFRYGPSDVWVPALNTYTIVAYQDGVTPMNRRFTATWRSEQVAPGSVSLLTRATQSHWRWTEGIEVTHVYLAGGAVADVAAEVYGRVIQGVELLDVLRADDPVLSAIAGFLAREAREGGLGGRLYVDALKNQACVHMLRHYANVAFPEPVSGRSLSPTLVRLLTQYVDDNLERNISLADLATVTQLNVFDLLRRFRKEFGCPPHAYVMRRRVDHAKRQLVRRDLPLKVVAANCGFSDQSHMTRLFRSMLGVTPAEYRRQATG